MSEAEANKSSATHLIPKACLVIEPVLHSMNTLPSADRLNDLKSEPGTDVRDWLAGASSHSTNGTSPQLADNANL